MKIATMNVGHCGQCPYYEASRRVSCHLAKRHTPATLDIPSWCPLPDAPGTEPADKGEGNALPSRCDDCPVDPKGKGALCSYCREPADKGDLDA